MQPRRHSLLEACANIGVGYGVALGSQLLMFPWFGVEVTLSDNLAISAWFTVLSLARSYGLRRWFTRRTEGKGRGGNAMSDLTSFQEAFAASMSGCVRTCECGRTFFDNHNPGYDWEPGEKEALQNDPNATALDHSVGTISLEGATYCQDCTCWHTRAARVMAWLDTHAHSIATYYAVEKQRLQAVADSMPVLTEKRDT
jgi:hypothetical protein